MICSICNSETDILKKLNGDSLNRWYCNKCTNIVSKDVYKIRGNLVKLLEGKK